MTLVEVQTVLAILAAAYWQGREMPEPTARLYAERLNDLPFEPTVEAVKLIIDEDPASYFPTIGRIREVSRNLGRHYPENKPLPPLPRGDAEWLSSAAPWFIKLQAARRRAGHAAGFPLRELADGNDENLRTELAQHQITADLDAWKARV